MSVVVDASAVLAVILGERGEEQITGSLNEAKISAVNLSEIYRRLGDGEMPFDEVLAAVALLNLEVIMFGERQAVETARLMPLTRKIGASFADRACLALALETQLPVYTADRRWSELDLAIDIRQIRA